MGQRSKSYRKPESVEHPCARSAHPTRAKAERAGRHQTIRRDAATMTVSRQNSNRWTSDSLDRRGWLKSVASLAVLARFDGIFPSRFNIGFSKK